MSNINSTVAQILHVYPNNGFDAEMFRMLCSGWHLLFYCQKVSLNRESDGSFTSSVAFFFFVRLIFSFISFLAYFRLKAVK